MLRQLRRIFMELTGGDYTPVYVLRSVIEHDVPGSAVIAYLKRIGWEGDRNYVREGKV